MKNNNAAIIVLYNPDLGRLDDNINAVINQVKYLFLVDNCSKNDILSKVKKKYSEFNNIFLFCLDKNYGIAHALNVGLRACIELGCEWLLTLDQDSVVPNNLIDAYSLYTKYDKVAIISCAINYNGLEIVKSDKPFDYVPECISSASYLNVAVAKLLGGMDESMFIDRVDFEFCFRAIDHGYKILRVNNVLLNHELGNLKLYSFGTKKIHVGNHSSMRKFYMAQNSVYLYRKHKDQYPMGKMIGSELKLLFKTVCFEGNRIDKVKSILNGICSGIRLPISKDNWI